MRIGLDAKRAFYNSRGLGNYSRNLIDAMVRTESDNSYFLFTPKIKNRIFLHRDVVAKSSIAGLRLFRSPEILTLNYKHSGNSSQRISSCGAGRW